VDASHDISAYRAEARATGGLAVWTIAWAGSLALARFGPELWGDERSAATWAAVVLNLAVGVGWILSFTRFLGAIDDLQRKLLQDALAVTLGVGWVVGFGYVVADTAGLLAGEVGVAALPILLGAVFVIAVAVGKLRYR